MRNEPKVSSSTKKKGGVREKEGRRRIKSIFLLVATFCDMKEKEK
jgi:hypothetical protein